MRLKRKSDVRTEFQRYHVWLERRFECTIKSAHSDTGGEFAALKPYLAENGIEQTMSLSYCPDLNEIAERTNRLLVESARSMLARAELQRVFWAEAIVHT